MASQHHQPLRRRHSSRDPVDQPPGVRSRVVGVVHDDRALFVAESVEQRVDGAHGIGAGGVHRLVSVGEPCACHRRAQAGGEQIGGDMAVLEQHLHRDGPPGLDELGTEHALAVAGRGLHHDDRRLRAAVRQPRTWNMVGRQPAHVRVPRESATV
jgi:hypothetical protein